MRAPIRSLILLAALAATAPAQYPHVSDALTPDAAARTTPPPGPGALTGAGAILGTFPNFPPSGTTSYHMSVGWDTTRATIWIGNVGGGWGWSTRRRTSRSGSAWR